MKENIPQHIAIVMDGNGRWAEQRGLLRLEGHKAGVESVRTVVRCCLDKGVKFLSLFAFSSENWSRPESEVEFLMQLFLDALAQELPELHKTGIALRFTGNIAGLSSSLRKQISESEKVTHQNTRLVLNLVMNYGGKWDIVQAVKSIAAQVQAKILPLEAINETVIAENLCTNKLPDPDLFIRTSGEQRISNFFLMQLAYTELYFTDACWPDFTAEEFEKALTNFRIRERRYGKTSEQMKETDCV